MSATLSQQIPIEFERATDFNEFFGRAAAREIQTLENREQPILGIPALSCRTNLFFGFFFDGTKNNYMQAEAGKNHSNVARLYDCFPGLSVPGVLPARTDWKYKPETFTHFFRTYIPGVASPFKEINDTGKDFESMRGAAMGYRAEGRILWALIQAINNVHRYLLKTPLISASEFAKTAAIFDLSAASRAEMNPVRNWNSDEPYVDTGTRAQFQIYLLRLQRSVSQHWIDNRTGRPKKIEPGIVQTIHVSIFGFSRGATQARAFTNWLIELCRLDAQLAGRDEKLSLGGFKLEIDFVGLFDTVASVGLGNTAGNSRIGKTLNGHSAWADAGDNLRIPTGIRCVHLVAAHEVRRSFPLDSIATGSVMPANFQEVVFPGVHSDIGCGYNPREQGRGLDPEGADMLARIPLLYMYKEARKAGVPLKLEHAGETAQRRFKVSTVAISALNAYLAGAVVKTGPLTAIMREQAKFHMQWRLARRIGSSAALEKTKTFARASAFDQNDLHSANNELENEIAAFEAWLASKGRGFVPRAQKPGFDNQHENEWEEIARWWKTAPPLSEAVSTFFDEYVHDSRAWFKLIPGNPDNEADVHMQLKQWSNQRRKIQEWNAEEAKRIASSQKIGAVWTGRKLVSAGPKYQPVSDGLTKDQRAAIDEYDRTGKIPRMAAEGREPFEYGGIAVRAGYLRFRKIYGGGDSLLLS
jgi:hypothetical protein